MTLEQVRLGVLDLWIAENIVVEPDDYTTFFQSVKLFYDELKCNNTELLAFNHLGDKWQVINRWIHDYENERRLNS